MIEHANLHLYWESFGDNVTFLTPTHCPPPLTRLLLSTEVSPPQLLAIDSTNSMKLQATLIVALAVVAPSLGFVGPSAPTSHQPLTRRQAVIDTSFMWNAGLNFGKGDFKVS